VSVKFELAPLIAVQKRRVEQARAEVRARNETFRQRASQRNAAYQRWEEGRAASLQEQQSQVLSISDHRGQGIGAAGLAVGAQRREWWRMRTEEYWKALAVAEQELAKARAAADEVEKLYRRARAREEALAILEARWRSAQAVRSERAEERIVEDLLANRHS
jgi:hypothetical protein